MRDVRTFLTFLGTNELTKEQPLAYKEKITAEYAPASVNAMLVALNCVLFFNLLFVFLDMYISAKGSVAVVCRPRRPSQKF